MSDTIVFLELEHGNIGRLLALLDLHADRVEEGASPDLDLLRLAFEYFREFPDACHHPKEDVVFRRLQSRDPAAAARVGDLLGDHEQLSRLTLSMVDLVDHLEQDSVLARRRLPQALREFTRVYRHHLEQEDAHFFPVVRAKLGREDWDLIDFAIFDARDPLFDAAAESRFAALRRAIFDHVDPDEGPSTPASD